MAFRFCVLGSGSSGNSIFVSSDSTALLVDAGLSGRETLARVRAIGEDPARIAAILITHEHADHVTGLAALRRGGVKLYANSATAEAVTQNLACNHLQWQAFSTGFGFSVGDIGVEPFSVCHDAYDPVGFALSCGGARVGVATDIGMATALVRERLKKCAALVIEANHDEQLLRESNRPWPLKQRIAGRQGHLSNSCAAELVTAVAWPGLTHVFLAHLSAECNKPEVAVREVREALAAAGFGTVRVVPTFPNKVTEVWEYTG